MCVSKQQFSADISPKASSVCLAHLFTYQDFDEGTLGLAYVAPSKPDIAGGLCSKGPHHQHPSAAVATTLPFSTLLFLHRFHDSPSPLCVHLLLPLSTSCSYYSPSPPPTAVILCLLVSQPYDIFVHVSTASPSSSNQQGAMYLNTGLTSTKNYGKTILTKVPGSVCVCLFVCVHHARDGYTTLKAILTKFHNKKK